MFYHYEKGWTAAQSFRDLNELYGEGTISERQCREWFARFKTSSSTVFSHGGATDYHVNRSLKNWQVGKVYEDLDEAVTDVKAWIASKNHDFFARGIDWLPSKWEAVIEVDGEYALE
uniref:Mos1 transposase HTH domain-containing protein n=1 Tax=Acrobeloides nanus TaxID=290746 RepID=A0A914EA98_9BILA